MNRTTLPFLFSLCLLVACDDSEQFLPADGLTKADDPTATPPGPLLQHQLLGDAAAEFNGLIDTQEYVANTLKNTRKEGIGVLRSLGAIICEPRIVQSSLSQSLDPFCHMKLDFRTADSDPIDELSGLPSSQQGRIYVLAKDAGVPLEVGITTRMSPVVCRTNPNTPPGQTICDFDSHSFPTAKKN